MADKSTHARVGGKFYCARSDGDFLAWMRGVFPTESNAPEWLARMVSERPELKWGDKMARLPDSPA
eukprot:CAMPEP_0197604644 /NCGR_PEP_ID=MMETSP1326-20131121/41598_1 /TAXON_ID=1155430 /ORGANISM="Genus nov. species nov., Strain RCC2288" /LENGTH=65 /DNA_ID=CAMNT_0043172339 /DNA_START=41 /DNA_END=235 /DNA_ORIENTATION=-